MDNFIFYLYFPECDTAHFGQNCASECTCVSSNTQDCNHVTGVCLCNAGWEGNNCEKDIDECKKHNGNCPGNSVCENKDGSHACNCNDGFMKLDDGSCAGKFMLLQQIRLNCIPLLRTCILQTHLLLQM